MAVFDPSMTAQKVADMLPQDAMNASGKPEGSPEFITTKGYFDATRKGRRGPAIPPELEITKHLKKIRVRIFNAGPWAHVIPLGSIGTAYIPGCPEDKPYVEMLTPLHELEEELYPSQNKKEYKRLQEEGRKMAIEILGEGRNQDRKQSKRHAGVFIAEGEIPTEKEVSAAKKALIGLCKQMVSQMDKVWDRDRKLAYDMFNPETFGKAARVLELTGKQKPWLNQDTPIDAFKCPACRVQCEADAPICHNCKGIVNEEAWMALEARKQSLMETAAPKQRKG
jgi:hypothetical protein